MESLDIHLLKRGDPNDREKSRLILENSTKKAKSKIENVPEMYL